MCRTWIKPIDVGALEDVLVIVCGWLTARNVGHADRDGCDGTSRPYYPLA
jgi:hypothetical protein